MLYALAQAILALIGLWPQIGAFYISCSEAALPMLTDGGLLAVLFLYIIWRAILVASTHEETSERFWRSYQGILGLPLRKLRDPSKTPLDEMKKTTYRLFVAIIGSQSALLLAWTSTWPQGILCLVLMCRYTGQESLAGFLAIRNLSFGLYILSLHPVIGNFRRSWLYGRLESPVLLQEALVFGAERAPRMLKRLLIEASETVLQEFLAGEPDEILAQDRNEWLKNLEDSQKIEEFRHSLLNGYLDRGLPCKVLYNSGHMIGKCQLAGFTAAQCKEIGGFTAKQCKDAGFSAQQCKDAGFSAEECKDAGFSCGDCYAARFSAKQCKDAAFTAEECRTVGFSARDCYDAGFPLAEAGFSAKTCKEAGWTANLCKDLAFSAKECKDAGFSVQQCKEAGFMTRALKEAGFNARELKDAGYTVQQLLEAGFDRKEFEATRFT